MIQRPRLIEGIVHRTKSDMVLDTMRRLLHCMILKAESCHGYMSHRLHWDSLFCALTVLQGLRKASEERRLGPVRLRRGQI